MLESVPKLLIFIDFSIHSSIKHIVFIMCLQQALTSIWQIHCLSFFFSLGYLGCLLFNMNFRICSVSVKNHIEVLGKLYQTFVIILGTSQSMKTICLCLFKSIYFLSVTFFHFLSTVHGPILFYLIQEIMLVLLLFWIESPFHWFFFFYSLLLLCKTILGSVDLRWSCFIGL